MGNSQPGASHVRPKDTTVTVWLMADVYLSTQSTAWGQEDP
jgi:hypothetical protein